VFVLGQVHDFCAFFSAMTMTKRAFIAGVAALFLWQGTAHGELTGQACIREMKEVFRVNTAKANHMCDPKTYVKPNEYGWVCDGETDPKFIPYQRKGDGARRKQDAICE
jgi:hypothetical protein